MNRKQIAKLRKSLEFFEPWCKWHMDDCVQEQSLVTWHGIDERFSYAVFELSETMSGNIEDGDPFVLKFRDLREKRPQPIEIRGAIVEPRTNSDRDLISGSTKNVLLIFIDRAKFYQLVQSSDVTIINAGLYGCYRKQLQNLKNMVQNLKNFKMLARDAFLSKLFINYRYKMTRDELSLENRITAATHTPVFHPDCNESQRDVIVRAINNRITLVKGPPGTGKTFTSAVLVHNLNRTKKEGSKILICTSSNVALDNIAIKILELYGDELKIVRVRSLKAKQNNPTKTVDFPYLDETLMTEKGELFTKYQNLLKKEQKKVRQLLEKSRDLRELEEESERTIMNRSVLLLEKSRELRDLEEECERTIMNRADVICTTCCSASRISKLFEESLEIDSLVIDECSQVAQPEALLPIRYCPKRVVVVGDDKQLGVVISWEIRDCLPDFTNSRLSLFEMLKRKGLVPNLLDVQYRMHPILVEFSNDTFYNNKIKNGLEPEDRQWSNPNCKSPFPLADKPLYFHCHNYPESEDTKCKSRYNTEEVDIVVETIKVLLSRGVDGGMIGVITPYKSQCKKIKSKLSQMRQDLATARGRRRNGARKKNKKLITDLHHIEVATVDAYQGREKDYIILSMVRSLERGKISFVSDSRRLNVSLTRARFGMVIIGNPLVLKRENLLHKLILYASCNGLLYDRVLSENSESITMSTFERQHPCIRIPTSFPTTRQ